MAQRIQIRRDTTSNWTSVNPILSNGELGYEIGVNKVKIGNGTSAWSSLPYLTGDSGGVANACVVVNYPVGGPWPARPDIPGVVIWNSLDPSAPTPSDSELTDLLLLPKIEQFLFALSSENGVISTGVNVLSFRSPCPFNITELRGGLFVASSSGVVQVDMNVNGVSFLSSKLTIDASTKTSLSSTSPVAFSSTYIPDDAEITFDIDLAGTNAERLKAILYGYQ